MNGRSPTSTPSALMRSSVDGQKAARPSTAPAPIVPENERPRERGKEERAGLRFTLSIFAANVPSFLNSLIDDALNEKGSVFLSPVTSTRNKVFSSTIFLM